jgi:predicted dithiol-disulfide oxidoreductase (DUF899 family)
MPNHPVVSRQEWVNARKELLAKEKELTSRNTGILAQIGRKNRAARSEIPPQ